jgi:N-acetyl-beta-hexosaminidase
VPAGKSSLAAIHFSIDKNLPPEAYRLQIGAKQTQISSLSDPGAFYAVQTIFQ